MAIPPNRSGPLGSGHLRDLRWRDRLVYLELEAVSEQFKIPEVIYLQVYGDGDKFEGLPPEGAEITWCADRINDSDVRYVIDRRHLKAKVKK